MRRKLLTSLCATLVALAAAELLVRWKRPADYFAPLLLTESGEVVSGADAVIEVMRGKLAEGEVTPLGSQLGPGIRMKGKYDRPRWDYFDEEGCVEYRTSSLGLRDAELPARKQPDELRILAVGDSFTFGLGVRVEDCWVQLLERALRQRLARHVEVINGGFAAGHRPEGYRRWLEGGALKLEPDLVLVGFCLNDMGSIPMAIGRNLTEPWLGGRSQLLALVQRAVSERRDRPGREFDFADIIHKSPVTWNQTQKALLDIKRHLEQQGVDLLVAIFPMLSHLDESYPYRGLHRLVRDHCERHGIQVVDLMDDFLGESERDLWVHPTDQHPNDVGHRKIADGLLPVVASWAENR